MQGRQLARALLPFYRHVHDDHLMSLFTDPADRHNTSTMERCPSDILARIFVLVCADAGRTGGILRLVSRRIAMESAPYRFWSVGIAGFNQLKQFEYAISQTEPSLRCVRHLMISDRVGVISEPNGRTFPRDFEYDEGDRLMQFSSGGAGVDQYLRDHSSSSWVTNAANDAEQFGQSFVRIIDLISSHVQSLVLLLFTVYRPHITKHLETASFPHLRDMTLMVKHQFGALEDYPTAVNMPNLRTLSLGSLGTTHQRWPWIHAFVSSCSELDTLHLRGMSWDLNTRHAIRHILGKEPVPFSPQRLRLLSVNAPEAEWKDGVSSLRLLRPVRSVRLREFLERSYDPRIVYSTRQSAADQQTLLEDGVVSLRTRRKFPDYAQVLGEWVWMLEEEALVFALG
jgi:hypothetical protein